MRHPFGRRAGLTLALVLLVALTQAGAASEELMTVPTRKGVTQGFLLAGPPGTPVASAILFAGGDLTLSPSGIGQLRFSFLVKMRERFARQGLLVAVVDTPSDRVDYWNFQTSKEHAQDRT
jgi:hypothetical protein